MKETLTYGPVPCMEDCAQVGSDNYHDQSKRECKAYTNQLRRIYQAEFGKDLPEGVLLRPKSFPHDFGSYHEVAATFDIDDEEAVEAAYWLDEYVPEYWDNEAKKELENPFKKYNEIISDLR